MLEYDDGEDFIGDMVDEVVAGTLKIIYDKYIERQLLPYTISQAKEALLTIIDVSTFITIILTLYPWQKI